MVNLQAGLRASTTLAVAQSDTAQALGSGDVPVLGTPRLIALCEEATVKAVGASLPAASTTVGTRVECDHRRPSSIGSVVTAEATLAAVDGPRLDFVVTVTDESGEIVGEARIGRVIVERDRFLGR